MKKVVISLYVVLVFILNFSLPVQAYGIIKASPVFKESNPKNNAVNVNVNTNITIKFLKPIKKGSAFSKIALKTEKGIFEKASLSIKGNVLSIKSVKGMRYNSFYILSIPSNSIKDYSGLMLKKSITIKFKTINVPGNKNDTNGSTKSGQSSQPQPQTPPGTSTTPQTNLKDGLAVHAFYSGNTKYSSDVEGYIKKLSSISFAWLSLEYQNGSVVLNDSNSNSDFHMPSDYYEPLALCKTNKIPAQIAIFSDGNTAKSIISNSDQRKILIDKIINSLQLKMPNNDTFEFDGVVIDFEGFRQTDTAEYYNTFLSELKTNLSAINKKLYVAVNVRSYWPGYDYKGILKYADKVILMAHDYEPNSDLTKNDIQKYINFNSNDAIYSLAPISRVKSDLEDLISSIDNAADKQKIWLQLNFGISQWQFSVDKIEDWGTLDNNVVGIASNPTYEMLMNRLYNKDGQGTNIVNGYINELQSPYITYYNSTRKTFNFLIYEDSRSIKSKIDLSKSEGIGGISLWRLGNIPDYNDNTGTSYYLNVWNTILKNIQN